MSCYQCACRICARNCELDIHYLTLRELPDGVDSCFFCDECRHYTGDINMRSHWRPECPEQIVARKYIEARARAERAKLHVIKEVTRDAGQDQ